MEIDFDLKENEWVTYLAIALVAALVLVGLAVIGQRATPVNLVTGEPRILEWADWQLLQAQREYNKEIAVLRADIARVAAMLQTSPDPVAASILRSRVVKDTKTGLPSLSAARAATLESANGLMSWSSGLIDRTAAIALVDQAIEYLK